MDDFDYFGMSPAQVEAARAFVRSQFALADFTINLAKAAPPEQRFESLGLRYDLPIGSQDGVSETVHPSLTFAASTNSAWLRPTVLCRRRKLPVFQVRLLLPTMPFQAPFPYSTLSSSFSQSR